MHETPIPCVRFKSKLIRASLLSPKPPAGLNNADKIVENKIYNPARRPRCRGRESGRSVEQGMNELEQRHAQGRGLQ